MEILRDLITVFFLISGLTFMLIGVWGIIRLPDAYQRLHASSKCSTLGLLGLLLGAAVHIGTPESILKALLTIFFAFIANPVGSHALAKSAHASGMKKWGGTLSDELANDQSGDL
tara:strand:+ start:16 stop:360 length:345 start_codon:yes stop_codon:yes gene_type:complete